ncbi:hypothetical protein Franean1_5517 [Parafrankia sp. EAN1pec]|nr:hypothetical protein Franean1_5517 [Frankia sp. EAN1pec]
MTIPAMRRPSRSCHATPRATEATSGLSAPQDTAESRRTRNRGVGNHGGSGRGRSRTLGACTILSVALIAACQDETGAGRATQVGLAGLTPTATATSPVSGPGAQATPPPAGQPSTGASPAGPASTAHAAAPVPGPGRGPARSAAEPPATSAPGRGSPPTAPAAAAAPGGPTGVQPPAETPTAPPPARRPVTAPPQRPVQPPPAAPAPQTTVPAPPPTTPEAAGSACHPSYSGVCLDPNAEDYDCSGGSGNGPEYVQGPVRVVGYDEFGLDSDGDGEGCE